MEFNSETMNAYLLKIVYQIICGEGTHAAQFDEQLRFVTAPTEEAAFKKAQAIGLQEEEVFYNNRQQLVQWKFVGVSELYALKNLGDGAEVFSQVKEADDALSYRKFIQHKAGQLRNRTASLTLQTA